MGIGINVGVSIGKGSVVARGDITPPTVVITSSESSPSVANPIPLAFELSEVSADFDINSITISGTANATLGNFAGSGTSYTCDATPVNSGTILVDVAEGAFHDGAGNENEAADQFVLECIFFDLRDDFTDTVAAGSVNGTTATPIGGTRTAVDTGSKISVGSSVLDWATGETAWDRVRYPAITRAAGKGVIAQITPANTSVKSDIGWDDNNASACLHGIGFDTSQRIFINQNFLVDTYTAVAHYLAVIMRANGAHYLIKGGSFTNWTLLYSMVTGNTPTVYPTIATSGTTSIFTNDFIRVPDSTISILPIVSDNFTASNGVLGSTRGGGSEESGGSGYAWTDQIGTWAIATNKATCSALGGGIGAATVNAATPNVIAEGVITRVAGSMGMVLRYTDANNYIKVFYDGTNWQIDEIVAGIPNTILAATAATYGATKRTIVSMNGTKIRLFYGDAAVGAEKTTAIITGNSHGLFTTDTGATFDNFVIWAKGNGGEYGSLNPFLA